MFRAMVQPIQASLEWGKGVDRLSGIQHTIPIEPQLQMLYREPESAAYAHYLHEEREHVLSEINRTSCLNRYSDVLHRSNLIEAFQDACIREDDIVLMFSIDSVQLYVIKALACWIYIWVVLNLAPERHYRKKHIVMFDSLICHTSIAPH